MSGVNGPSPSLTETSAPASQRWVPMSAPSMPVVTSPSISTSSTSDLNPPVANSPQAPQLGAPFSPPPPTENALVSHASRMLMSRMTSVRSRSSSSRRPLTPSPLTGSASVSGAGPRATRSPARVTCSSLPPMVRFSMASRTLKAIVRTNRIPHSFWSGSEFSMVPVAVASLMYPPTGFESVIVKVSVPSSLLSLGLAVAPGAADGCGSPRPPVPGPRRKRSPSHGAAPDFLHTIVDVDVLRPGHRRASWPSPVSVQELC